MTKRKHTKQFVDGIVAALADEDKTQQVAPKVAYVLQKMSTEAKDEATATVESSITLNPEQKTALQDAIVAMVGHPIEFEYHVNKHVIAGTRIKVGDLIVDTSFAQQLDNMAALLKR